MKEILAKFKKDKNAYTLRVREIDEEYEKINNEIKVLREKQENLMHIKRGLTAPNKTTILLDIAEEIAERLDVYYEVRGPFGPLNITTIYFFKKPFHPVAEQEFMCLSLCPDKKKQNWFKYDTGKESDEFIKGSNEYYMGFNHIFASLPMDFNEVIKIVEASKS